MISLGLVVGHGAGCIGFSKKRRNHRLVLIVARRSVLVSSTDLGPRGFGLCFVPLGAGMPRVADTAPTRVRLGVAGRIS